MISAAYLFSLIALFVATASCKQVRFPMHLTWDKGAPDGNARYMIYVNGQFPAPELRLRYGDSVEVGYLKTV